MISGQIAELPRLLPVPLAAAQLSISERHLRTLIARGSVPAVRIGRRCLIARTTLDRIAAEGITS